MVRPRDGVRFRREMSGSGQPVSTREGRRFHINEEKLKACIEKQDTTPEQQRAALANSFRSCDYPSVFVNGAKFEGAVPIDFVFDMVDNALRAEGQVPPPRKDGGEQTLRPSANPK